MNLNLSDEQQETICSIIGEWYLMWKNRIADYDDRTHRLGYAKEQLKQMICYFDDMRKEESQ